MCSTTADVSGEPVMRNALVKACRRIACCTHCGTGCSHAPRPGRLAPVPTITAYSPFPIGTATTRSSSTANSRFRHPTHVRTGPSVFLCAHLVARLVSEAEGSRWITAKSSVTQPMVLRSVLSAYPWVTQSAGERLVGPQWGISGQSQIGVRIGVKPASEICLLAALRCPQGSHQPDTRYSRGRTDGNHPSLWPEVRSKTGSRPQHVDGPQRIILWEDVVLGSEWRNDCHHAACSSAK
jgi:hypothetical protein